MPIICIPLRLCIIVMVQRCSCDFYVLQLYEEPAAILQIQQSVAEGTHTAAAASPQSTCHSSASSLSPNMTNMSTNQDTVDGLLLHNLSQPHGSMVAAEQPVSPAGNLSEVISGKIPCQECFITNEEKQSVSETTTSKFGLNTRTASLDIVPPCKGLVLQAVYTVRSPPLEVVKEESVVTASHLDSLSIADTTDSDLIPDNFPVGSALEQLDGVLNPVIVSATNEVLIAAALDTSSNCKNALLFSSASQLTTDITNQSLPNSTENIKPHALDCSVKDVPSSVILTEQRLQFYPEESVDSFVDCQHKKTNFEQPIVFSSMIKEEEATKSCVSSPDIVGNVGSCDLLLTDSKRQESMNRNLPTQNMFTFSQSSSGSAVNVITSVSSPLLPSIMFGSMTKKSVQKATEIQNKQHEGQSATPTERETANCISQTASFPDTLSITTNSRLKSESVLKDSSAPFLANRPKPEECSKATESAFSCVKAVVVHEVSLPELSVPCQTQASMPSQSQLASACDEVTPVNTNSHTGGLSLFISGAKSSQNKQICRSLNEDKPARCKKFPEEQSSISTVPTKAVVISTRQRKLATACPPNISSLTRTVSKTAPVSVDSKKTQCTESSCTSGSLDFTRGETVKTKSKVKK
jgi:hypothetical protein